MKKLINEPGNVVREMLEGLAAIHGGLVLLPEHPVLLRADAEQARNRQVALISGGGSGHEPAHGGYVGAGMLSAAVAGEVFTSPTPDAVLAAIHATAGEPGALLIVKNYTGDRLNFGLAAEMARAGGTAVEMVVVADDVALEGTEQYAGARGLAGTALVHKVTGAAAAEGRTLREVSAIGREAASAVATMGVALSAGTVPGAGKPSFTLDEDEVELGLGIHGEPGLQRVRLRCADELADELVQAVVAAQQLNERDRVAVMINNLGATTGMELAIFARRSLRGLAGRGLTVERVYAGTFMTSLDAAGVSLSIMRVDDERLRRLDASTSAPAWPNAAATQITPVRERVTAARSSVPVPHHNLPGKPLNRMQRAMQSACRALVDAEDLLTELDRAVGDGDLGANLARGAKAIEECLPRYQLDSPADALKAAAVTLQRVVGGSSGPFYAVALLRAASSLQAADTSGIEAWARAALEACDGISKLGDAKAGDRTMLDALLPFANVLTECLREGRAGADAMEAAVQAAEKGAEATATMLPRRGRSSYLGERAMGHPDPGAVAVAIWLRAVASSLEEPVE